MSSSSSTRRGAAGHNGPSSLRLSPHAAAATAHLPAPPQPVAPAAPHSNGLPPSSPPDASASDTDAELRQLQQQADAFRAQQQPQSPPAVARSARRSAAVTAAPRSTRRRGKRASASRSRSESRGSGSEGLSDTESTLDMQHLMGGASGGRRTRKGTAALVSAPTDDTTQAGHVGLTPPLHEQAIPKRGAARLAHANGVAGVSPVVIAAAAVVAPSASAQTISASLTALVADLPPATEGEDSEAAATAPTPAAKKAGGKKQQLADAAAGTKDIRGFFGAHGVKSSPSPPAAALTAQPNPPTPAKSAGNSGAKRAKKASTAVEHAGTPARVGLRSRESAIVIDGEEEAGPAAAVTSGGLVASSLTRSSSVASGASSASAAARTRDLFSIVISQGKALLQQRLHTNEAHAVPSRSSSPGAALMHLSPPDSTPPALASAASSAPPSASTVQTGTSSIDARMEDTASKQFVSPSRAVARVSSPDASNVSRTRKRKSGAGEPVALVAEAETNGVANAASTPGKRRRARSPAVAAASPSPTAAAPTSATRARRTAAVQAEAALTSSGKKQQRQLKKKTRAAARASSPDRTPDSEIDTLIPQASSDEKDLPRPDTEMKTPTAAVPPPPAVSPFPSKPAPAPPAVVLRPPPLPLPLPVFSDDEDDMHDVASAITAVAPSPNDDVAALPRAAPSAAGPLLRSLSSAPTPRLAASSYRTLADMAPSSTHGSAQLPGTDSSLVEMKSADTETDADAEAERTAELHDRVVDNEVARYDASYPVTRTMSTADTPRLFTEDEEERAGEGEGEGEEMSMDSPVLPPHMFERPAPSPHQLDSAMTPTDDTIAPLSPLARSRSTPRTLSRQSTVIAADAVPACEGSLSPVIAPVPVMATPPHAIRRSHAMAAPSPQAAAAAAAPAHQSPARGKNGRRGAPVTPVYDMSDLSETSLRVDSATASFPFRAAAAAATCCGSVKSINQDAFVCSLVRTARAPALPDTLVLAVADGHGVLGHSASALVQRELGLQVQAALLEGLAVEDALRRSIARMHRHMNDDATSVKLIASRMLGGGGDPAMLVRRSSRGNIHANGNAQGNGGAGASSTQQQAKSPAPPNPLTGADYGTTLVACVVQGSRMTVAHVGDSRFMLFQRLANGVDGEARAPPVAPPAASLPAPTADWQLVYRTREHNCDDPSEAERVVRDGGKLHTDTNGGDIRVYPGCYTLEQARQLFLTINMSRSLGHIKLGVHGISAEPDVCSFDLQDGTESCIVMGSDGLTDILDVECIRNLVTPASPQHVQQSARELLQVAEDRWQRKGEAQQRRLGDNITAVVLRITPSAQAAAAGR